MELKIDNNIVKSVIESQVRAAIIKGFDDVEGLLEKVVGSALSMKVDYKGQVSKKYHLQR